jgi:putative transposase
VSRRTWRGSDFNACGRGKRITKSIRIDNGPEFTSKALDQWAYLNGVELDFIRPGKPTDNALIEAFNGHFSEECLNESWFLSLEDARGKVEEWRQHYNWERPHSSPDNLTLAQYRQIHGGRVSWDSLILVGTVFG